MKRLHARTVPVRPGTFVRAWFVAFVTTTFLLTTSRNSFALEPLPEPGKTKITAGAGLMFVGGVTTALGIGLHYANENSGKRACTACQESSWILPTVLVSIGAAAFLTGGVVFGIGQVERAHANTPTATLTIGPLGGSIRVLF
jgi:hypothetical protein